jgi:hypothetical protein
MKFSMVSLWLVAALFPAALPQANAQSRTVQFAKGASSATLSGSVRGDKFVDYTLRASAGQTMQVSMASRLAYFNVLPPGSKDVAIYNSSIDGNDWRGQLENSGVYTVRIYLMRNEARRGTAVDYVLKVAVTGSAITDAKVAGTPFHAVGEVLCIMGQEPPKMCPFGVVRSGPGNAEVRITPPGGIARVLRFEGGRVTAPDSQAIQAEKLLDEWTIKVNGFETYRIPAAVPEGG